MSAGQFNFTNTSYGRNAIEQGATWDISMVFKDGDGDPVDLTGYTARMMIRKNISDATPQLELSTTNGRIIITAGTGGIQLLVEAEDTADLDFVSGVYDLEIEDSGGVVTRLMEGEIELSKEVTR